MFNAYCNYYFFNDLIFIYFCEEVKMEYIMIKEVSLIAQVVPKKTSKVYNQRSHKANKISTT